ncbi:nitrogenase component 1 [Desulforegula conservatrix]|uniref:nitrogenase component 1 n=1 Tax=Desulforegula conservatrix TaxID=153026 RepID=UPI00041DCA9D|nr:nitrogenase component 1 [Desulforegula conservatrix]
METNIPNRDFTQNACKLCAPLGACLAYKGVKGAIPFLHGSQGCATYIRRYLISHFREPLDIAASNFSEASTIFGGGEALKTGLLNIVRQYSPEMIGVASTCLSETIGEDVPLALRELRISKGITGLPSMPFASTPSYAGTHADGFQAAVLSMVKTIAGADKPESIEQPVVNILPGMLSTADLRHLREISEDFGLKPVILPDYSETLDGGPWAEYQKLPSGGTSVEEIKCMGASVMSVEFGKVSTSGLSAAEYLEKEFHVTARKMERPIGVKATDLFMNELSHASGKPVPEKYEKERARLIDSYVDGHKYVAGKTAAVFGEADMVTAICGFLSEIGITPVIAASGDMSSRFVAAMKEAVSDFDEKDIRIIDSADFRDIEEAVEELSPDILIGSSKGFAMSRKTGVPLLRAGMPIHDRMGGARILQIGYRGTQAFFDSICNTLIENMQEESEIGYTYI